MGRAEANVGRVGREPGKRWIRKHRNRVVQVRRRRGAGGGVGEGSGTRVSLSDV